MTDREWAPIEQLLAAGWSAPNQWDAAAGSAYRAVLDGYEPELVALAIRRLIERGSPYRPSIAEIVAALNAEQAAITPTWDEVYAAIWEPGGVSWTGRLAGVHELIALYVERRGGIVGVRREQVADPDYGGAVRQRLRVAWDDLVAQSSAREREGRALEALGRASRGELARPDWSASLTAPASPTTPTPIDAPAPTGDGTGGRAHSSSGDRLHSRDLGAGQAASPALGGAAGDGGEVRGGAPADRTAPRGEDEQ